MIDPVVPLVVAIVLATLLVMQLALLLGHAAWVGSRRRRLAAPIAAARGAVVATVDRDASENDAVRLLRELPERERITVLADLAPTVRGLQRERLELLARQAGVLDVADRWARSRRWWRRLHSARLHSLLGGSRVTLEPLLDDRSWEVRAEAAGWASEFSDAPVTERLLMMLDDPEPLPRFAARDSLRRIGKPAAGPLTQLLESASRRQAAAALDVAVSIAEPGMLPAALHLRKDQSPATRARSATLLGALGGEAAVAALVTLLEDPEPGPRAAAAHALGKLGHWPAAGDLSRCLRDPSWDVRRNAALALRDLGSPGELLLRRARDGDERFASDIARQVLDLPRGTDEAVAT